MNKTKMIRDITDFRKRMAPYNFRVIGIKWLESMNRGKGRVGFVSVGRGGGGWPVAGSQSYISYEGMRCYEDKTVGFSRSLV